MRDISSCTLTSFDYLNFRESHPRQCKACVLALCFLDLPLLKFFGFFPWKFGIVCSVALDWPNNDDYYDLHFVTTQFSQTNSQFIICGSK